MYDRKQELQTGSAYFPCVKGEDLSGNSAPGKTVTLVIVNPFIEQN